MMEHREGQDSRECLVPEGHGGRITNLDIDIPISQTLAKRLRQCGIEFKASEAIAVAA